MIPITEIRNPELRDYEIDICIEQIEYANDCGSKIAIGMVDVNRDYYIAKMYSRIEALQSLKFDVDDSDTDENEIMAYADFQESLGTECDCTSLYSDYVYEMSH